MFCKVGELMTSPFFYVKEDSPIDACIELFLRHHISGLPVLDDKSRPIGVISEYDLLALLYEPDRAAEDASTVMTHDVVTIDEDASLVDATDLFLSSRMRRLPVVSKGRMVGILSRRELVRHIGELRKRMTFELEKKRQHSATAAT